jgi:hypothetical protein
MMREVGIYNTFFTWIWQFMQRNPELGPRGLKWLAKLRILVL